MAMRIKRIKSSTFGVSATDSTTSKTLIPRQLGYEASTNSLVFNNADSDASGGSTSDLVKFKSTSNIAFTDLTNSGTLAIDKGGTGATSANAAVTNLVGSSQIGSGTKPIYYTSGAFSASGSNVGTSTVPIYMNSGELTQCSTTLGVSITGNAATATKLATERTISISGDAAGSATFDGSDDASISLTLANSGVNSGSYGPSQAVSPSHGGSFAVPRITVDAKGRVTSATSYNVTLPSDNNTTYSAGTGLSLSGTTFNHASSITASNVGPSSNSTLSFGGTFSVPYLVYNATGHLTSATSRTMTMPTLTLLQGYSSTTAFGGTIRYGTSFFIGGESVILSISNATSGTITYGTRITSALSALGGSAVPSVVLSGPFLVTSRTRTGFSWERSGSATTGAIRFVVFATYAVSSSSSDSGS